MWVWKAEGGSDGRSSKAVWVEVMMLPFGRQMLMPGGVATTFSTQGLSL
jgi:hypothetical protein